MIGGAVTTFCVLLCRDMAAPMENATKGTRLSGSSTSFQKKSRSKLIQIPGTKPSVHTGQLIVSSGVPSLDCALGESV